jgi:hypothetical protein
MTLATASGTVQPNLAMTDYVADNVGAPGPTLSSSLAHHLLTRSPLHAWYRHPKLNPAWQEESSAAFDLGSAVHAVLLEGRSDLLAIIDVPDWRTSAAKTARDEARAAGKIPLLPGDGETVERMVAASSMALGSPDLAGLGALEAERTYVWEEDGHWYRCRPDWATADCTIVLSYKTTSLNAEPSAYTKTILNFGYDMQAAFERRGIEAATGVKPKHYIWIVQETAAPYATSLVGLAPDFAAYGHDRMCEAMDLWGSCIDRDYWPGYPNRICYVSPPAWARAELDERMDNR